MTYQRRFIYELPSFKHRFIRLQLSICPMMVHLARARNKHHGLLKLMVNQQMGLLEVAKSGCNVLMGATSVPMVAKALFLNGTKNELSEHYGF